MKTNTLKLKSVAAAMLALTLVAAPSLGFAKENEHRENNEKKSGCIRAFGHLVAPGLVKVGVNTDISLYDDCRIPGGILKKINGRKATTTPDIVAPVISNTQVKIKGSSKVEVRWNTNEKSVGAVFFGTTTPVVTQASTTNSGKKLVLGATSTNSSVLFDREHDRKHEVQIKNLSASTTYYAVIVVQDKSGNVTISSPISFTTGVGFVDTVLPIITNLVTNVGTSSIRVSWKTNEPATSKLFYGTSTINTSSSLSVGDTVLKKDHSLSVSGLATGTTYHLVPQSIDAAGNITTSADYVVSTSI